MESTFNLRQIRSQFLSNQSRSGTVKPAFSNSQSHTINRCYYYPYFKDKKIDAQKVLGNTSNHTVNKKQSWVLNPGLLLLLTF